MANNFLTSFGRDMSGVQALADALRLNSGLTKLDVSINLLSYEAKDMIQKAVEGRERFALEL